MTLEQLKYLKAIVETGSFRAAAESVFRSQSSLSISIQKLEQELGVTLFTRDNYRPELTDAGRSIYQKADALLEKSNELVSLAHHLASGYESEVRLAISGIVPVEPIIEVLNQISTRFPQTRIQMQIENLGGTMERLLDDDADIAISDAFDLAHNFESFALPPISFVTVVPSSSPWAAQADTVCESDLGYETLIVVRDTSNHSPRISKGIYNDSPQWVVNDFATKQRIICSGKGWGRMPLHLVKNDIQENRLTKLTSPDFKLLQAPIHLVRNKQRAIGPVEETLWTLLQNMTWPETNVL